MSNATAAIYTTQAGCHVGVCAERPSPALYLLPQRDAEGRYAYLPVCRTHAEGWWDDEPGGEAPYGVTHYMLAPVGYADGGPMA
jgi:hypothetical protein